jgi:hypothetical protein
MMEKKTWVAPTVTPLASAEDAQLGRSGPKDLLGHQHAPSS